MISSVISSLRGVRFCRDKHNLHFSRFKADSCDDRPDVAGPFPFIIDRDAEVFENLLDGLRRFIGGRVLDDALGNRNEAVRVKTEQAGNHFSVFRPPELK